MSMSRSTKNTGFTGMAWRGFASVMLSLVSAAAFAEDLTAKYNFQEPVTSTGHEVLGLHNLIMMITGAIMILVMLIMFASILLHRKSNGKPAATFSHSTTMEVVWTVIPFLILVGMAIPSTKALLRMDDTSGADMTVKITGYQWKWRYNYPEQGIDFFSNLATPSEQIENKAEKSKTYLLEVDNELVLPVGKKIRFILTANDVIHAWWVPQLAVKKDAIPGYINEMWTRIDKPGIYRGQCAELCGKNHGFMPIVVRAVTQTEFDAWANKTKGAQLAAAKSSDKTFTKDELMEKGKKVFTTVCAGCHGVNGVSSAPAVFPSMKGSKIANGPLAAHLDIVMNGSKKNPAMQAFKAQMTDVDLAAVITYERNAFGNTGGGVVQPKQIKSLR